MNFSTNEKYVSECTPVYEEFEGNFGDISNVKTREELPINAQKYLNRIEEVVGIPIKFIGIGPNREDIIAI
jgi:adenylosuccinate synthase